MEIGCHGGVLVTRRILDLLLRQGARSAEPGEFTQRAFLNGKMDLTQAEAVMDLISAQTDLGARRGRRTTPGPPGAAAPRLCASNSLRPARPRRSRYIRFFPDEDIEPETGAALLTRIDAVRTDLELLLSTAGRGRILREGLRTVIYGAPNVGKSSLLNLLLGYERAIVSAAPGTTRDSIEEVIDLRGIPLRLTDTAGIRDSADAIEREGIARTLRLVESADLVLHLEDGSEPASLEKVAAGAKELLVLNKSDLPEHADWQGVEAVRISCLHGGGLPELEEAIVAKVFGVPGRYQRDWSVAINARHQASLQEALAFSEAARSALTDGLSPEFVAEELRSASWTLSAMWSAGSIPKICWAGSSSTFCIGK